MPSGGGAFRGERGERGEVVAALPGDWECGGVPYGRASCVCAGGGAGWLLRRLAETPDVTLRGLLAELAERGIVVSYYAVWHFFEHEGISFKKKPARQRAGSAGRRPPARQVEAASGQA